MGISAVVKAGAFEISVDHAVDWSASRCAGPSFARTVVFVSKKSRKTKRTKDQPMNSMNELLNPDLINLKIARLQA